MSAVLDEAIVNPNKHGSDEALEQGQPAHDARPSQNYKGFVAGVFSGISKLTGEMTPANSLSW